MMKDLIKEHALSFVCLLETHVAGDKAMRIVQRMGLGAHHLESARGHSGGIWCSWDPGKWTVTVLRSAPQCVHMRVKWLCQPAWLLTVVYGSPQPGNCRTLWHDLREIGQHVQDPWCLIGDFNAVLHPMREEELILLVNRAMLIILSLVLMIVVFLMQGSTGTHSLGVVEIRRLVLTGC